MPERFSDEFENEFYGRFLQLSTGELCDLLALVKIRFPTTTREELEQEDKADLIGYLDEADSRRKVERFLKEKKEKRV